MVLKNKKVSYGGLILILLSIGALLLGIVIKKDPYDPGFIQFCEVFLKIAGFVLCPLLFYFGVNSVSGAIKERKIDIISRRKLLKELDEIQTATDILNGIPTFEEYMESHCSGIQKVK